MLLSNFVSTSPLVFNGFSLISNAFISIHEYSNKIVIMSDHCLKTMSKH